MRIVVTIASSDPPEGHLTSRAGDEPAAFVGWLGLIRLLADAVAAEPSDNAPEPGERHVRLAP